MDTKKRGTTHWSNPDVSMSLPTFLALTPYSSFLLYCVLPFLRKDNQRKGKSEWVRLSHGVGKARPGKTTVG